jgi:hypothetical protein
MRRTRMTARERLLSVYRRNNGGTIPWGAYGGFLLPSGSTERKLRNAGCGWIQWAPVCTWQPPGMGHMNGWMHESEIENVEVSLKIAWEKSERILYRRYDTPIGSVYEELREEPGYHSLWVKKFLIGADEKDYAIVKYMVEHTVFRRNYETFLQAQDNVGEDGVTLAVIDRSPFQKLLIELCGTERLSFDLADREDLVKDLLISIEKKQDEAFEIIADSPAEIVWMVDNLTADITEPKLFKNYCLPYYNKQAKLLHARNKVFAVHFDGKLKNIKNLIRETGIDVIESFTLPGMGGDLPIEEAIAAWPDKSIIANIPAFLCYKSGDEIREYLDGILRRVSPSRNFMLELSENFPLQFLDHVLTVVADVMAGQ